MKMQHTAGVLHWASIVAGVFVVIVNSGVGMKTLQLVDWEFKELGTSRCL